MNLQKFNFEGCSLDEFIEFWQKIYGSNQYSDKTYHENINYSSPLSEENIQELIEWKVENIPGSHEDFKEKSKKHLPKINQFRNRSDISESDLEEFWKEVASKVVDSGMVFKGFLLHLASPKEFPIIDRHVMRAKIYLESGEIREDVDISRKDLDDYKEYREFFSEIKNKARKNEREIDKALWSFGKFLKSIFASDLK